MVLPPFLLFTLFVGLGDVAGVSLPTWQVAIAAVCVAAAVVGVVVGRTRPSLGTTGKRRWCFPPDSRERRPAVVRIPTSAIAAATGNL